MTPVCFKSYLHPPQVREVAEVTVTLTLTYVITSRPCTAARKTSYLILFKPCELCVVCHVMLCVMLPSSRFLQFTSDWGRINIAGHELTTLNERALATGGSLHRPQNKNQRATGEASAL